MTKKRILALGATATVVVAVIIVVWFQPQKLLIDETVEEAAPAAQTVGDEELTPVVVAQGSFESLAHKTTGSAKISEIDGGEHVLRLENFETDNGPDLRVYLSAGEPYGNDFVDLGGLKGNIGDQNYAIPPGTDLEKYTHAVIWCRRFTVGFGVAKLA